MDLLSASYEEGRGETKHDVFGLLDWEFGNISVGRWSVRPLEAQRV